MAEPRPPRADVARPRAPLALLGFFLLVCVLLHARSFAVPHTEGDEIVYLTLAREMHWDLSHYTTRDDPVVTRYPHSIYRQELFHHPPLFALVLKLGHALGQPVVAGLLFQVLAVALLLVYARRAALRLELPVSLQAVLYACLTFCPLLVFSTTRLHHDGLLAIFLFCAFTQYVEALETRSTAGSVLAGLLFALALNVRYSALAALPLVLLLQLYALHREAATAATADAAGGASPWRDPRRWKCFAVVSLLVAVLGLPHYVRILLAYGTLLPGAFVVPDADAADWNRFVEHAYQRSRLRIAVYLAIMFPWVLTWLAPAQARRFARELRAGSWAPVYAATALYLFAVNLAALHDQVRYFAMVTPFLFAGLVAQLREPLATPRGATWFLAALTLLFMLTSSYAVLLRPAVAVVVPAPFILLPFLQPFYV